MTVAYLPSAGVSWIASCAAMTGEVHCSGQTLPGLGVLDCGLRRNDGGGWDDGGVPC